MHVHVCALVCVCFFNNQQVTLLLTAMSHMHICIKVGNL